MRMVVKLHIVNYNKILLKNTSLNREVFFYDSNVTLPALAGRCRHSSPAVRLA